MDDLSFNLQFMPPQTFSVFNKLSDSRFISKFTLVGGTALAIQLEHRMSEDLDFVLDSEKLNINTVKRNIAKLFPQHKIIRQDAPWQIDFIISDVKVTFFSTGAVALPFKVSQHVIHYRNIAVCRAKTIATLKMAAIAQRNTIRDYYDIYILAKKYYPLKEIIQQSRQLMPNLSPITYTETLIYTNDIEEESLNSHLSPSENISKEQIAAFFVDELRKIKDEID